MVEEGRDDSLWYGYWRPSKVPSAGVPLGARSVGRARIRPGWLHPHGRIQWVNLYWGVDGVTQLGCDGVACEIRGGELMMHPTGALIEGVANERAGAYRWCTVDGSVADDLVHAFGLEDNAPLAAGPCPVDLFDALESRVQTVGLEAELAAGEILYRILTCAAEQARARPLRQTPDPLVCEARRILDAEYVDPDLSIDAVARRVGMHRSRLSRLFRAESGLPPVRYLRQLRLRKGVALLKTGARTVAEAAQQCGFRDPAYFSRCLRRETGRSPRELRRGM